jgi:putative transcriptional regulator
MVKVAGTVRLRIDDILKERGMTVQEFADKTGFVYNTALSIQRGAFGRIGLDTIARICDALAVTPGELFEYRSPRGKP